MNSAPSLTLIDTIAVRRESPAAAAALRFASMGFIAALTAAAAQLSVPLPFTDVPLTVQPTIVLLGGLALGARLGFGSQLLYLAAGIAGLPVFAASAALPPGPWRLLGPTGGYLMAYPLAAFAAGYLAERGFDRRYLGSVAAMLAGLAIIYLCGSAWLAFILRSRDASSASIGAVLAAGVYPFVIADLLKLMLAAGVLPGLWHLFGRSRHARRAHDRRK